MQVVVADLWLSEQCAAVYINNKQLQEKKKVQKHAWRFEDGSDVEMSWNLYMPGIGNAVVMQTGAALKPASASLPLSLAFPLLNENHSGRIYNTDHNAKGSFDSGTCDTAF